MPEGGELSFYVRSRVRHFTFCYTYLMMLIFVALGGNKWEFYSGYEENYYVTHTIQYEE